MYKKKHNETLPSFMFCVMRLVLCQVRNNLMQLFVLVTTSRVNYYLVLYFETLDDQLS